MRFEFDWDDFRILDTNLVLSAKNLIYTRARFVNSDIYYLNNALEKKIEFYMIRDFHKEKRVYLNLINLLNLLN